VAALTCGLMFAAMLGAISAMDSPMACQTDSDRRRPPPVPAPAMAPPRSNNYPAKLSRSKSLSPQLSGLGIGFVRPAKAPGKGLPRIGTEVQRVASQVF
jgi:hypothetical protein